MLYTSTRDKTIKINSAEAIVKGISEDGGLFVPKELPKINDEFIASLIELDYKPRAKKILSLFLEDFSQQEISAFVDSAYAGEKFDSKKTAPTVNLYENVNILELFKGPTCAFKDMALQLLPHLLTGAANKMAQKEEIVILVATSGDTGKAALEGFCDIEGVRIIVFYPNDGVSPMQKLQMTTQEGNNVGVCAIDGNFDDAQNGVKAIFANKEIKELLKKNNLSFSSANSINWGRLVPQIVYYISSYCDLVSNGSLKQGDKINITVPTGNFGNILAAYYAMKMGLPVNRLICASNTNNVLTDFLKTGKYDRNRVFYATASPSMDILISSNLERLLFDLADKNDAQIRNWFDSLSKTGKYEVSREVREKISEIFDAGFCDDDETKKTIREIYNQYNYLCDTHTAVAINVYNRYRKETGDTTPAIIASTASPFKFCASVLEALRPEANKMSDEFAMLYELEKITGLTAPAQLRNLSDKKPRFNCSCKKSEMPSKVIELLGIQKTN